LRVDVRKRLGDFRFSAAFDLPLQGLTAIFGASGAGKSTLMNLICGLHRPDGGRIAAGETVFFDEAGRIDVPVQQRGLGVVFQDTRLFPHLTVAGNLVYGLKRAGQRAQSPPLSLDAAVDLLGLRPKLQARPGTLSGGEKQRVALGRALLACPRLLLMDEPFASLDAARKAEILPVIERLRDETRIPILYVSHSLDEVLRLATALVVLDHGRVVEAGAVGQVLQQASVRQAIGAGDVGAFVFGRVAAHDNRYQMTTIDCAGFELHVPRVELPVGAALRARVPSRDVALSLSRPSDVSISNRIPGTVESIAARHGPDVEVNVRVSPETVLAARITHESADRLALVPGLAVWCLIKSVALDVGTLNVAHGRAAMRAEASANEPRIARDGLPR
jgi:molybdate transport system ATP-binding protein